MWLLNLFNEFKENWGVILSSVAGSSLLALAYRHIFASQLEKLKDRLFIRRSYKIKFAEQKFETLSELWQKFTKITFIAEQIESLIDNFDKYNSYWGKSLQSVAKIDAEIGWAYVLSLFDQQTESLGGNTRLKSIIEEIAGELEIAPDAVYFIAKAKDSESRAICLTFCRVCHQLRIFREKLIGFEEYYYYSRLFLKPDLEKLIFEIIIDYKTEINAILAIIRGPDQQTDISIGIKSKVKLLAEHLNEELHNKFHEEYYLPLKYNIESELNPLNFWEWWRLRKHRKKYFF